MHITTLHVHVKAPYSGNLPPVHHKLTYPYPAAPTHGLVHDECHLALPLLRLRRPLRVCQARRHVATLRAVSIIDLDLLVLSTIWLLTFPW